MNFDPNSLLASILVSGIGLALLRYGRTHHRWPQGIVGVVMIGYPYLVDDVVLMFGLAAVLLIGLWLATKVGF